MRGGGPGCRVVLSSFSAALGASFLSRNDVCMEIAGYSTVSFNIRIFSLTGGMRLQCFQGGVKMLYHRSDI